MVILYLACIIVACCALYSNTFKNSFIYDDTDFFSENYSVRNIANAYKLFTPEWKTFSNEPRYRPVSVLPLFVYYNLFETNQVYTRAVNLVFHICAAGLVFFVFLNLEVTPVVAFFTALLFAIHPVNTEVNNIITFNDDVIAGILIMASLLVLLNGRKAVKSFVMTVSISLLFIIAFFAKESAIVLPLLLFVVEFFWYEKKVKSYTLYITLSIIAVVLLILKFTVLRHPYENSVVPFPSNVLESIYITAGSLKELLFTVLNPFADLSLAHTLPVVGNTWMAGIIIAVGAGILGLLWYSYTNHRKILGWVLFSLIAFIPALYAILLTRMVSERFMYVSGVGICFLIVYFTDQLVNYFSKNGVYRSIVLALICVVFTARAYTRNMEYGVIPSRFWEIEAVKASKSSMPHCQLAEFYLKKNDYPKVVEYLKKAAEITPGAVDVYVILAHTKILTGDNRDLAYILDCIQRDMPVNAKAYYLRGLAYEKSGNSDKAVVEYEHALKYRSSYHLPLYALGRIYKSRRDVVSARKVYDRILALDPVNIDAGEIIK
ncbi:MAG: hypothetical protein WC955_08935 [Elusimicrobiota bacterium]